MEQLTNEKALQIIKEIMDAATKGGLFPNMDATFLAANAFNVISKAVLPKSEKVEHGDSVIN
jgi:hypothetical protein